MAAREAETETETKEDAEAGAGTGTDEMEVGGDWVEGGRGGRGGRDAQLGHFVGGRVHVGEVEERETQTDRPLVAEAETLAVEIRPETAEISAQAVVHMQEEGVQHSLTVASVECQMPSRPSSAKLVSEWHLVSTEEAEEAIAADIHAQVKEAMEDLLCAVEDQVAFDEAMEGAETGSVTVAVGERRVVSAKNQREDRLFVRAMEERKAAEARTAAVREEAEERERLWEEERAALESELMRREEEVEALKAYLNSLPVVKVTETVDASTGKLVDDPKYEYSRVPLEEERAMHLQEEAERAFQRTLEAEAEAERARRAAAEEAFRFEAAKAEVRLEAYRMQQRLESEAKRSKAEGGTAGKMNPRRGAEPELKEGWVTVKRSGIDGGLQRRMYVLRTSAILSFADESRQGGCLNALGLERIERFCKGEGSCLEIHPRDGNPIVLHCGGLQARDSWLISLESALKRFRSTSVAQPLEPSPAKKVRTEVEQNGWDASIEEKLRRQVDACRTAVSLARQEQARADKILDEARAQHQRLDREIRLRQRHPEVTADFLACLPEPEARRQVGMGDGGGGGGGISVKELEGAIAAAKKKAEEEHRRTLQQVHDAWQTMCCL